MICFNLLAEILFNQYFHDNSTLNSNVNDKIPVSDNKTLVLMSNIVFKEAVNPKFKENVDLTRNFER